VLPVGFSAVGKCNNKQQWRRHNRSVKHKNEQFVEVSGNQPV
jgi:hypothetical protein